MVVHIFTYNLEGIGLQVVVMMVKDWLANFGYMTGGKTIPPMHCIDM